MKIFHCNNIRDKTSMIILSSSVEIWKAYIAVNPRKSTLLKCLQLYRRATPAAIFYLCCSKSFEARNINNWHDSKKNPCVHSMKAMHHLQYALPFVCWFHRCHRTTFALLFHPYTTRDISSRRCYSNSVLFLCSANTCATQQCSTHSELS